MSNDVKIPEIDPSLAHGTILSPEGKAIEGQSAGARPPGYKYPLVDETRWPRSREEYAKWTDFFVAFIHGTGDLLGATDMADAALVEWRKRKPASLSTSYNIGSDDDPLGKAPEERRLLVEEKDPNDPLG